MAKKILPPVGDGLTGHQRIQLTSPFDTADIEELDRFSRETGIDANLRDISKLAARVLTEAGLPCEHAAYRMACDGALVKVAPDEARATKGRVGTLSAWCREETKQWYAAELIERSWMLEAAMHERRADDAVWLALRLGHGFAVLKFKLSIEEWALSAINQVERLRTSTKLANRSRQEVAIEWARKIRRLAADARKRNSHLSDSAVARHIAPRCPVNPYTHRPARIGTIRKALKAPKAR